MHDRSPKLPEVTAYPDFELPFFITCDTSNQGLGAVLFQKQHGINRVISYASRILFEAEINYNLHSGKLEFLALDMDHHLLCILIPIH